MQLKIRFPSQTNTELFKDMLDGWFPEHRRAFTWENDTFAVDETVGSGDIQRITETAQELGGYEISS